MPAPSVLAARSSTAADSSGTTHVEAIPSGSTATDTLIAVISGPDSANVNDYGMSGTDADSWQLVARSPSASSCPRAAIFVRPPNGVAPQSSYTFTKTNNTISVVTYARLSGVDPAAPISVAPVWASDTDGTDTAVAPSITTPAVDHLLLCVWACTPYATGSTTDVYSLTVASTDGTHRSNGPAYQAHLIAWQARASAGATGTRTATFLDTGSAAGPAQLYASLAVAPGSVAPPDPVTGTIAAVQDNQTSTSYVEPPPRTYPITRAERVELLSAPHVECWLERMDVLDHDDQLVGDITRDVESCKLRHDGFADVHGSIELVTTADLPWGGVRVRPWIRVAGNGWVDVVARGVFILGRPRRSRSGSPASVTVAGRDKLHLLNQRLPEAVSWEAGQPILHLVRQQLSAVGIDVDMIDQARADTLLPEPRNWPVTEETHRIHVVNAGLEMVGYRGLRMDLNGLPESGPYVPPTERPTMWTFDTADPATLVLAEGGDLEEDDETPNKWVFWSNVDRETPPAVNDGLVVIDNLNDGPASQQAVYPLVVVGGGGIEAVDQEALELNARRIAEGEKRADRRVQFVTDVVPYFEHQDVFEYIDRELGTAGPVQHVSYEIMVHEDGGKMTHDVRSVGSGLVIT